MTVVTFESYTPSPRFDGIPWTKALIQESALATGPWVTIETKIFSDPDADPTKPKTRNFTTENAVLPNGWYQIIFTDDGGNAEQPTAPVYNGPISSYEPTIDQVARKILSRTRDKYGNLLGTFNDDTTPNAGQVQQIVEDVITEIQDAIGDVIPPALYNDAANVVALRAAMQIELDFYSDQVNTGRSIYPQLLAQYKDALLSLHAAVTAANQGGGTVIDQGAARLPSYSFPTDPPIIGLKTVW